MGFLDALIPGADEILGAFTGGGSSSKKSDQSAVPGATKDDINAALAVNLNSINSLFQTYSMQSLQQQELIATEDSSKQLLLFAGIGGMVLVTGLLVLKR